MTQGLTYIGATDRAAAAAYAAWLAAGKPRQLQLPLDTEDDRGKVEA